MALRHLRTTMRLTVPEMARLTGVSARTIQYIEAGRSAATLASARKLLGVFGLRLAGLRLAVVGRVAAPKYERAPRGN